MNLPTGIGPLDDRIAGFRRSAVYLLTGGADTAKLAFILQFLQEGLRNGERVALLCAAAPEDVLEQADYLGIDLATPWHDGTCVLMGFKGEYPRRIVHAPDPAEAFNELERLVSPPVDRIGIDPGSFLWSTRAGTSMAQGFADWVERSGATVVASVASGLGDRPDPSTEWVLQRASGVLHFARLSSGLHEVDISRFTPPVDLPGPVTLELAADRGLVAPTGRIERRSSDRRGSRDDPIVLAELGSAAPDDLVSWLDRQHDLERVDGAMALLRRLQSGPAGLVCLYVERSQTEEAIELLRTSRPITTAPLILLSDRELRSSDRAAALGAGADDVLSGGIDLKELDARIRRAKESSPPDAAPEATPGPVPVDGLMETDEFRQVLRERLGSTNGVFSLVRFEAPDVDDFGGVLTDSVRAESGDLVAPLAGGFGVLLQDARTRQAEAFLRRVQKELRRQGHPATLEAELLFSTDEAERIRKLAGA